MHIRPIAAQDLRLLYQAKGRGDAERRLYRWLVHCADSNLPELHRLARTIDAWREELLAYFDTGGISNGLTEAMNLLIKEIPVLDCGNPDGRDGGCLGLCVHER